METVIRSNEEAKREFERLKRSLKSFQVKKDKVIITRAYFGHEVKDKETFTFTNNQYKNTFIGYLESWERLKRWGGAV